MAGVKDFTDNSKLNILFARVKRREQTKECFDPDDYRKNSRSNKDIQKSLDVLKAIKVS